MDINSNNYQIVANHIRNKLNYNRPYYATDTMPVTDMDHLPYRRFFRGVYSEPQPVIFEREAGFRPLNEGCYLKKVIPVIVPNQVCWEYPCSNIKPCKAPKEEEVKAGTCSHNFIISP